MAREWQDYIGGTLETPFGPMDFALTEGSHVSIHAGGSSNKSPEIIVNGVPYYTHLHLHLMGDGAWGERPADVGRIYMSRGMGKDASDAAKRKATAGITEAWVDFISMGSNPSLLNEAEARHINNKIMDVEKEAEEARQKYEALAAQYEELLAMERQLGGR